MGCVVKPLAQASRRTSMGKKKSESDKASKKKFSNPHFDQDDTDGVSPRSQLRSRAESRRGPRRKGEGCAPPTRHTVRLRSLPPSPVLLFPIA